MSSTRWFSLSSAVTLAMTCGVTGAASQEAEPTPWRFAVGESFEYVVGLGNLRAGRGVLAVEGYEDHGGVPAYKVSLSIQAGGGPFKFEDEYTSWIALDPVRSLRIEKKLHEGNKRFHRRYELDYQEGAYRVEEWDDGLSSYVPVGGPDGRAAIPDPALDDVAFLYLLRLLSLEPGASYEFRSHFEREGNPVSFRVLGRERVRVPAGRFNTLVVLPTLPAMGIFSRDADARLYLSDDPRRLIVKLTTTTRFGTIALHLRSYEEGTPSVAEATIR
jgi:hypothetical protein